MRRVKSKERGQALIELALLLPFILLFVLALVDFGIAIDRREVLQHAVYEGARDGSVGRSIDEIKQETVDQSQGLLDVTQVTVCYSDADGDGRTGNTGDNVRVSADFTYRFSVGSGELLSAAGIPVPSIQMTPHADMTLYNSVTVPLGAVCP